LSILVAFAQEVDLRHHAAIFGDAQAAHVRQQPAA
jgi:hypothetical protein